MFSFYERDVFVKEGFLVIIYVSLKKREQCDS